MFFIINIFIYAELFQFRFIFVAIKRAIIDLIIFINIEYGNIYFFIINPVRFLDVTHISFFLV